MSLEKELEERSGSKCELCRSSKDTGIYVVAPKDGKKADECAFLCAICQSQIDDRDSADSNHWRCLNESAWSQVPSIQVLSWRMLNHLKGEGWPSDILDMLYLDEETLEWAKSGEKKEYADDEDRHRDSNGVALETGDTVLLIKDLPVKGGGFNAKRGTVVRNISLVANNTDQIEGRVNGMELVLLTKFVKKQ